MININNMAAKRKKIEKTEKTEKMNKMDKAERAEKEFDDTREIKVSNSNKRTVIIRGPMGEVALSSNDSKDTLESMASVAIGNYKTIAREAGPSYIN